ncbi:MAG: glutamine amidotransferase [Solobacterium sp.]|nr:glutamine amidotransferase [Solobacterium sp.]
MKLKMVWMYHDLMDLYGDKGNTEVIRRRCEKRGIECVVDTCTIGEEADLSSYDLFFLGGGADREQSLIFEDLISRKQDIEKAMESGTTFLLICGGYQLFGKYYKDQDGNIIDGLGFFDYYTESTDRDHRCIGNIALEVTMDGDTFKAVGFENHGGQTKNVTTPLGKVLFGHGNTYKSGYEGFVRDNVLATYMHGPLLPKNPMIADRIIKRALKRSYGDVTLEKLDDTIEDKAREVMLKRLKV